MHNRLLVYERKRARLTQRNRKVFFVRNSAKVVNDQVKIRKWVLYCMEIESEIKSERETDRQKQSTTIDRVRVSRRKIYVILK